MAHHNFISMDNIMNIYMQIYFQVITHFTFLFFFFFFFYLQVVDKFCLIDVLSFVKIILQQLLKNDCTTPATKCQKQLTKGNPQRVIVRTSNCTYETSSIESSVVPMKLISMPKWSSHTKTTCSTSGTNELRRAQIDIDYL